MSATDESLAFAPALDQAALILKREVSPVELVELYLARIERIDPALGSYLTVPAELALAQARRAEAADGDDLPAFHGVPISLKDEIDTAGIRSTHGTAAWADRVPERDDELVTRIKRAGFIVLGKTNMPEFGMATVTEPPGYQPCRNPWDLERTPGGSSGGAAAALAAGLCPVSHGADGGGSIRVPSSLCGVFGIKPARGRVSAAPRPQHPFTINGPIARTVADAAALLDVMQGYATGDAFWAPPPDRPFLLEAGAAPGRLRVAFTTTPFLDTVEVGTAQRTAAEDAARLLADLGHEVEEAAPEWDRSLLVEITQLFGAEVAAMEDPPPRESLDPWTALLAEAGRATSGSDMARAQARLQRACRRTVSFFDRFDVLVTPTVGISAPRVGEFKRLVDQPEGVLRYASMAAFTSVWNLTGQPAVSLPLARDEDGLPVGVQVVGRPADEATLIRLSAQVEAASPWIDHRPLIS